MPYIYATALPGNIVKIGRATSKARALAGQMFYVERLRVLALWETPHHVRDEARAHEACARWHVCGELFRVPSDWLDDEHLAVVAISAVLGAPLRDGLPTGNASRQKGRPVKGDINA